MASKKQAKKKAAAASEVGAGADIRSSGSAGGPSSATAGNAASDGGSPGSASSDAVLIYIHGIGRQLPPAQLKDRWDLALFGRTLGERSRMAYWADLLHGTAETGSGAAKKAAAAAPDPTAIDLDAWLGDAAGPEAEVLALGLLQRMGTPLDSAARDTSPRRRGPGKKVLPLPAWARRPISRAFLHAFIHDTAAYFFTPGMRAAIRERLAEQIRAAAGRPITLVAHSQGTIVSYELLCSYDKTAAPSKFDAFVTLGSPLGLQEVQDWLDPGDGRIPQAVTRWHNFSDLLDPVALDHGLAGDFRVSGSDARRVRVQDEVIRNQTLLNPHSSVGYLAHPTVRRVVNDAMRMDTMARFVIARDVAERLGDEPEVRNSVLIEVLEPGYAALGESKDERREVEEAESRALAGGAAAAGAAGRGSANAGAEHDLPPLRLEDRIRSAAARIRGVVADEGAARVEELRRFVAARLTPGELQALAVHHREMRIYAVWQSARKSKLTDRRSLGTIKADAALASFSADGAGITWAVLDTGVQADHPHFANGTLAEVWDCTQQGKPVRMALPGDAPPKPGQKPPEAVDPDGHGTHVSGIIAGASAPGVAVGPNDESGLRGVAPRARLVVYKVLADDGTGEDAWIIKALDHIAEKNENVSEGLAIHGVNLSLGGPFDATVYGCGFSPICAELRRLWRGGTLVVVACGNEGKLTVATPDGDAEINTPMSVGDPANLEECVAVGSVNADRPHLYGISPFSSRGPTADGRAKPDLVAPGERILSCNAHWKKGTKDQYFFESGTSMAAPHVSGLLAAFLSVRREFRGRPDEVKKILLESCIDLGRDRYHQGCGLPNLMRMLLAV